MVGVVGTLLVLVVGLSVGLVVGFVVTDEEVVPPGTVELLTVVEPVGTVGTVELLAVVEPVGIVDDDVTTGL